MDERLTRYVGMEDSELVACTLDGDDWAAVYAVTVLCGPGLRYLVRRKYQALGLEFDEAVSELFVQLRRDDWRALRDFRGYGRTGKKCQLKNYLLCIFSRMLCRKMDRRMKENAWLLPLYDQEALAIPDAAQSRCQMQAEAVEAIMSLDDSLDRTALLLSKVEGRDASEVASLMGTTPGNVYTRCCRALKKLRAQMQGGRIHA